MRGGPKVHSGLETAPLNLSKLPNPRGARAVAFMERFLKVPKGKGAGKRFRVRPWQADIVKAMFRPGVRQGLALLPRGQGKSTLCVGLGLFSLYADSTPSAQVILVSPTERQSLALLAVARRMVETNADLAARTLIYADRLYVPSTDSTLIALPATPAGLQGWDPTTVIVDELHVLSEEQWDSMALATGKRERSLVLGISTAGDSKDSVLWRLVEHGRARTDKQFAYVEYAAPDDLDPGDERAWEIANPALDDFLARDALRATYRTTRPEVFARFRLNRWLSQHGSWLPWDAFEARIDKGRLLDPDEPIVLGLDASLTEDSTALVYATVNEPRHIGVIAAWEKDEPGWRTPRVEIHEAIHEAFETLNVRELAADPYRFEHDLDVLTARYGERVLSYPSNALRRMAPATDRLRTAIMEGTVTFDGHEALGRHFRNAVVKSTPLGDCIVKDRKGSPRKIDLAVASVIAHERAQWHATQKPKRKRMVVLAA